MLDLDLFAITLGHTRTALAQSLLKNTSSLGDMVYRMNSESKEKPLVLALAPTVLDIEASGLGRSSYPIEVGFVLPDGHAYCTLVQPEDHWTHWDESAAALHRITRDLLHARGVPAKAVACRLNEQLGGQTVYSDGWANDYTWLHALFDAANMRPHFKLENLRSLLSDVEANQWHKVKAQISSERGSQRHRASSDARLLQLTLQRLRALQ